MLASKKQGPVIKDRRGRTLVMAVVVVIMMAVRVRILFTSIEAKSSRGGDIYEIRK